VLGRLDGLVAKGYRFLDRDQQFLLPENMGDWLPASDPVWLVISVVAGLDTSRLHARRRIGGAGRAGYDPDMLLTLLIWAWAQGVRSSRVIERLCRRDVAFRIICAGDGPDHVTISRFRAEAAEAMGQLFAQVLMLCARVGMGQVGVVALDSVKIAANASIKANYTADGLRREAAERAEADMERRVRQLAASVAAEHAATDVEEDALYGADHRGDELPAELADPRSRAARIAAALAELTAKDTEQEAERRAQLEAFRHRREQRAVAPMGLPPAEIRVEILTENLADARARHQAKIDRYHARGKRGRPPVPVERAYRVTRAKAALERAIAAAGSTAAADQPVVGKKSRWGQPKRNLTDPDSRAMPLQGGGWIQGYNCQAVTSSDGMIIATSVSNNFNDATAFTTALGKAVAAAVLIDAHRPADSQSTGIGVLLADAGYLSAKNLTVAGPDRLIAVGKSRYLAAAARHQPTEGPPRPGATPVEAMTHRLRTPEGHALYKQRSHIAETPFAHAKHNLGFRRFTSRGLHRATAEFSFHALVHNLFKAIGTGHLTPAHC
jgi:transposase